MGTARARAPGQLPGIVLLVAIGLVARLITAAVPVANYLIVTVAVGVVVGNTVGVPTWAERGVGTHKLWLEAGIVIMGARLALNSVAGSGARLLALVLGTVAFSILLVEFLSRFVFRFSGEMGSLLASGMSICGVSAVVAVAASIRAREQHVAYAVGAVLVFDALTLFTYPIIGSVLGLPDRVFGVWVGVSMLSTGPVAAAGFAYSPVAGEWATLTKLSRNALIGLVAVAYSLAYTESHATSGLGAHLRSMWETFPKFVFGFVAFVLLASVGFFTDQQVEWLRNAYSWLFMIAFAGLGLSISVTDLRRAGLKPLVLLLVSLTTVSALSLWVVTMLFTG